MILKELLLFLILLTYATCANYYVGTDPILLSNYDCNALSPCYLQFVFDHNATDSDTIIFASIIPTHVITAQFTIRSNLLTFAGSSALEFNYFGDDSMFKCENAGATNFTFAGLNMKIKTNTTMFSSCLGDMSLKFDGCNFDFAANLHSSAFFSNRTLVDLRFIKTNFSVSKGNGNLHFPLYSAANVLFFETITTDVSFYYIPWSVFKFVFEKSSISGSSTLDIDTQFSPKADAHFIESEIHNVYNGGDYFMRFACCYRCNSKVGTWCTSDANLLIDRMNVHDNYAERGVFHLSSINVTVVDSYFNRNHAENDGGCFYVETTSMTVERTRFYNNFAGSYIPAFAGLLKPYGGGVICSFSTLYTEITIRNSEFINNTASGGGGDLFFMNEEKSKVILENNIHVGSKAHDGGALYFPAVGMSAVIINSTFTGCSVKKRGGAFYVRGGDYFRTCSYHNFVLIDTKITKSRAEMGGAIFIENCCFIAEKLEIDYCVAKYGGGMYIDVGTVRIDENQPSRNETGKNSYVQHCGEAGYTMKGGGIYASEVYFDTYNDFNVSYNKAYYGAGIYVYDTSLWSDVLSARHGSFGLFSGTIYIMYNEGVVGAGMAVNSRHFGDFWGKVIVRDNVASETKARDVFMIEKLFTDWSIFASYVNIEDHARGVDCRDHFWNEVDCLVMTYPILFLPSNDTINEIFPNEVFGVKLTTWDSFGKKFEVYDDYMVNLMIDGVFEARGQFSNSILQFSQIQIPKRQNTTVELSFESESHDFEQIVYKKTFKLGSCGIGYGYSSTVFCSRCNKFEYKVEVGDVPCSLCPPRDVVSECASGTISLREGYWGQFETINYMNYSTKELVYFKCLEEQICLEGASKAYDSVSFDYYNQCRNETHYNPSSPLCLSCKEGYSNWQGTCKECQRNSLNLVPFGYFVFVILILLSFQHLTSQSVVLKRYKGESVEEEQKVANGFPLILSDFIQTSGLLINRYNLMNDLTLVLGSGTAAFTMLDQLIDGCVRLYIYLQDSLRTFLAAAFNLQNSGGYGLCPFYISGTGIIFTTILEKLSTIVILILFGLLMGFIKRAIVKPLKKASIKARDAMIEVSSPAERLEGFGTAVQSATSSKEEVEFKDMTRGEKKKIQRKREREKQAQRKIEYNNKGWWGKVLYRIKELLFAIALTLGKSLTFSGSMRTLSRLLIISHLPLTTAFLDIITCSHIGGSYYLLVDTNVKCYEDVGHILFMVFVGIPLGIYVFCLPWVMLFLLIKFRDKVRIDGHRSQDYLREYFANYKLQYYWYEIIHTFRRMSLAAIVCLGKVVIVSYPTFAGSDIMICGVIMSISLVLHILIRPYKTDIENVFEMISLTVVLLMIGMQEQGTTASAIIGRFLTSFCAFAFSVVLLVYTIYYTESVKNVIDKIKGACTKCRSKDDDDDDEVQETEEELKDQFNAFKNWKKLATLKKVIDKSEEDKPETDVVLDSSVKLDDSDLSAAHSIDIDLSLDD